MDQVRSKPTGMTLAEAVVVFFIIAVLVALLLPSVGCGPAHAPLTTVLSQGKQIHQAAYKMVLDNAANPNPALGWPGDLAVSPINPVTTTGDFVERLVAYKYLDRGSLARLFGSAGNAQVKVPPYPGHGPFEGRYGTFNFFKVTEKDDDAVLFLATKNFHYGSELDPKKPYGTEGAVIVRKGGDAQKLNADQAKKKDVGHMPGGTWEDPGEQEGNTLKD